LSKKNKNPRAYPDRPFVGVGVVIFRGNKILLAERDRHPHGKMWSIPGGAQELGETVSEAAIREISEETGLVIKLEGLVDVVDVISKDREDHIEFHYTLVDFYASWVSGEAVADDDVSDVKWVSLEELQNIDLRPITRQVITQAIEKYFT
jgi:8-oxo-dGTP diphosphatase